MPETINKWSERRTIGGVFSSRVNADKAIQAFRKAGVPEEDIHVIVSLTPLFSTSKGLRGGSM
jgi:hypothetical protein